MRKTNYLCAMFAIVVGTYASQNAMATENNGMRTVTKLQQQERSIFYRCESRCKTDRFVCGLQDRYDNCFSLYESGT